MQISPGTPIGQRCQLASRIQTPVLAIGRPIETPRAAMRGRSMRQTVDQTVVSVGP